jgi:hypothetical protein
MDLCRQQEERQRNRNRTKTLIAILVRLISFSDFERDSVMR